MSNVVHLKWGEEPASETTYLTVTRHGRIRGEDYIVGSSLGFHVVAPEEPRSFASLDSALRHVEVVAQTYGVETIYVRMP